MGKENKLSRQKLMEQIVVSPDEAMIDPDVSKVTEEKAIVHKIDLRPIGLDIHGQTDQLWVGKSSFVRNTFVKQRAMIGIGG